VAVIGRFIFGAWELFMASGFLAMAAIVVKLGFYSPLIGGILVATCVVMGVVAAVWHKRANS
jgi:hypothetical protein